MDIALFTQQSDANANRRNERAVTQMEFQISLEGRTIVAQPRPEDQDTLDELLGSGKDVTLGQADGDTEGHTLAANEITVDVEGHAMTLRLPHAGDAAALKRALAVGTLTATVAIGGFVAGSMAAQPAAPLTAPAVTTVGNATGTYAESEKGPYTGSYAASEKGGSPGSYVISEKGDDGSAPVVQTPDKTQQGPSGHQGPRRE
jgi:hypothetical protein